MSEHTPRIETNDGVNILIINGKLSRETTARHIVKVLAAHDTLVAACELAIENEECVCGGNKGAPCMHCRLTAAVKAATLPEDDAMFGRHTART